MISVKDFKAAGNGINDDSDALQKALDMGGEIYIPEGEYKVTKTLKVKSGTKITADSKARIVHSAELPKHRGDFLITNSDFENGNENISIVGGIWDGDYDGANNDKPKNLFDEDGWSGTVINFYNVKNLSLSDMEIANSVVYHTRFCRIDGFDIRNIRFSAKRLAYNQDGLHFGGECRNGYVENIRAVTDGETNDDLIALNADDSTVRIENLDLICGDIENITFKNIYAKDCHTAIRFLSVNSSIRNIKFENVFAGCREFAINMDGARYCATPLFREEEFPQGCGNIENIEIDGFEFYSTDDKRQKPLIGCESRIKNFVIRNMKRTDENSPRAAFRARNIVNTKIVCDKKEYFAVDKSETVEINGSISEIHIN